MTARKRKGSAPRLTRRSAAAGHAAALALGTVVAGVAAYGYITLGTRTYGAEDFAPIAVIWSVWPAAAAAFGFPLEQWIARELAAGPGGEARVRTTLRGALPVIAALCSLLGIAAWAAGDRLFGDSGALYPAVLAAVSLGAATMGLLRGSLAGRGRYLASAIATALENGVRLMVAGVVLIAGWGLRAYALVLAVGPLVALLWPQAFHFRAGPPTAPAPAPRGEGLAELAGASLLAQLVLAAPPVALAAFVGPTAAVTAAFAALALLRAPYLVAVGVSVRALPGLTRRLAVPGGTTPGALLARVAAVAASAAVAAFALAPLVMPPVLRLVFGEGVVPSDLALAGLAAGVMFAHGALAGTMVLLAAGRQVIVLRAWLVACAVNVALLVVPLDEEDRVAVAFAAAEAVAVFAMALAARRVR